MLACTCPSSNLVIVHCNGSGRISDLRAFSFLSELHYREEIGQTVYDMYLYKYCTSTVGVFKADETRRRTSSTSTPR